MAEVNSEPTTDCLLESNKKSAKIMKDARKVFSGKHGKRIETIFYKIVLGGDATTIDDVLKKLDGSTSDADLYRWLLNYPSSSDECDCSLRKDQLQKWLKYLILIPLWIILTPVFYILHSIMKGYLNSQHVLVNSSPSRYERLDFPLAFAVFSERKDMIKLFLHHKVPIHQEDKDGNNVMHYLADLSAYDLPKATRCYEMLFDLADEPNAHLPKRTLHDMIVNKTNKHKQNALEYCFQFGGLKLGLQMLLDTLIKCKLMITDNQTVLADKSSAGDEEVDIATDSAMKHSDINEVKVKVSEEGREDTSGNNKYHVMYDTTNSKLSASSNQGNCWSVKRMQITQYTSVCRYGFMSLILHLMNSRPTTDVSKENWESVQENKGIQKWMECKFNQWKLAIIAVGILEIVETILLIFFMLNFQGDMFFTPNKDKFITNHVQIFLENWQKNDSTAGIDTTLRSRFFTKYYDLPESLAKDKNVIDYTEMLKLIKELKGYENYSFTEITVLYNQLCSNGSIYQQVGDLIFMDNCTTSAADLLLEDCTHPTARYRKYFHPLVEYFDPYEFAIVSSFENGIFNDTNSILRNDFRIHISTALVYLVIFSLVIYFFLYLILDNYCRIVILKEQITNNVTWYSICGTPLPGSYVKAQCKIFTSCAYLLVTLYYLSEILEIYAIRDEKSYLKNEILSYDRATADNIRSNWILGPVVVFMLVSRIILHLYCFRLFPLIGNFVITTFEMATDLFQFIIVYIVIVIVFAVLFYWFSRDSTCPFFRDDNNFHLGLSLFTTFSITFGYGELNFDNYSLRFVYVVYVVMSIILLLNLIIAVMSSTASEVTVEPWKSQLYQEALNSEALGVEHWVCAISPCKQRVIRWTLRNTHFEIDKSDEIYLEYFEKSE